MTKLAPKEQLEQIKRGVAEIISEEELLKKLERSAKKGKPLRIKLGVDPTAPDIHLGHTVVLQKMRQFQDLGHTAVLIIGDYTGLVGDPTGRSKTRPKLTIDAIEVNAKTYLEQVHKVLAPDNLEIVRNGDWFKKMQFHDVMGLAGKMTVARLLERDDFEKRYKAGQPISLHEFFYPAMQGWDSVEIKSDVELGGTDQKFNLLVGRDLQRAEGQESQVCLTMPILEGIDGGERMSKSLGNYIGVTDAPNDMFGKAMSIPDNIMLHFYELLTTVAIEDAKAAISSDPKGAKVRLGKILVERFHSTDDAEKAAANFEAVFANKQMPDDIPEINISGELDAEGRIWIVKLVSLCGHATSNSEARRLIQQGGVSLNEKKVTDANAVVEIGSGWVLQTGKRKFAKLIM